MACYRFVGISFRSLEVDQSKFVGEAGHYLQVGTQRVQVGTYLLNWR